MIELEQGAPDAGVRRFLFLCLLGRWDPAALETARTFAAQVDLNWHSVSQVARIEGLGPLLYPVVRGQNLVPPSLQEDWRVLYYLNVVRNTHLSNELREVVRHLAAEGIVVIVLKGVALSETVYGNPGLRPMSDLDLLVRRRDVRDALDALAPFGYRPSTIEPFSDKFADWEIKRVLYKNGPVPAVLDLHWCLFSSDYHQYTLSTDWFWETALPAPILGTPCSVLGPEGQILHLCAHLAYHHGQKDAPQLLWLHDVAEVIRYYQTKIDWAQVLDRAKAYDLVLPLQLVLTRVVEEWHAPVPNDIQEKLHLLRPSPTEVRVFNWCAAGCSPGVAENLWTVLVGMRDWRRRFAYAWRNLFPSPAYMRERYGISHSMLVPLYYPYRWFLGLRSAL